MDLSAYVGIRQHTSACVSILSKHILEQSAVGAGVGRVGAYVRLRSFCDPSVSSFLDLGLAKVVVGFFVQNGITGHFARKAFHGASEIAQIVSFCLAFSFFLSLLPPLFLSALIRLPELCDCAEREAITTNRADIERFVELCVEQINMHARHARKFAVQGLQACF
jgi:hypothetical protein